ncbi:TPA: IS5 family transposase, partial [Legionella pneumophila]|nr:IS5 family transposase [Legionella pneumophila]HAU3965390.1 IS5 family transposase [Legionella pneumophila]
SFNSMMMSFTGEGWGEGMSRMVIDDEMWFRLEKLLPKPKGRHGEDDRLFMEAICWMLRTGAAWRDLPLDYGNRKSVYNRYNNWSKKGYITAILAELKKDGDHEWHMLDGSIIKVHQDAMRSSYDRSAEAIGSSVGGLSTKIHAMTHWVNSSIY